MPLLAAVSLNIMEMPTLRCLLSKPFHPRLDIVSRVCFESFGVLGKQILKREEVSAIDYGNYDTVRALFPRFYPLRLPTPKNC